MKKIPYHPLADLFHMMSTGEMLALTADIKANGLFHPITLYEGKILDGRHRHQACLETGVSPRFVEFKGDDPLAFVLSANLHRRHLTESQRAMLAAKVANMPRGGDKKSEKYQSANLRIDQTKAAERLTVSPRSVSTAVKILDEAPKLAKQVSAGTISLHAAAQAVKKKAEESQEIIRDETGYPIPAPLHALWHRRGEIRDLMAKVTNIETLLLKMQEEKDALFEPINFSSAVSRAQYLHMEIKAAQLHAVCTTCQGRNPSRCSHCKGRGFLTAQAYKMVPSDQRAVREKGCQ